MRGLWAGYPWLPPRRRKPPRLPRTARIAVNKRRPTCAGTGPACAGSAVVWRALPAGAVRASSREPSRGMSPANSHQDAHVWSRMWGLRFPWGQVRMHVQPHAVMRCALDASSLVAGRMSKLGVQRKPAAYADGHTQRDERSCSAHPMRSGSGGSSRPTRLNRDGSCGARAGRPASAQQQLTCAVRAQNVVMGLPTHLTPSSGSGTQI